MSAQFSELPEDQQNALMHFGVKGMKWGKRRASSGGEGGTGNSGATAQGVQQAKPLTKSQEIKAARGRQREREQRLGDAEVKLYLGTSDKVRNQGRAEVTRIFEEMHASGDDKLARKSTKGEKIARGLLYGGAVVGALAITGR